MNSALRWADEWSFEVNSERTSSHMIMLSLLGGDRVAESIQRAKNPVHRSGDCGGQITGYAAARHRFFKGNATRRIVLHYVVSGPTVYVDIDVTGSDHQIGKVEMACLSGKF